MNYYPQFLIYCPFPIEPPANESVNQSLKRLRDVGAIDHEESLTPLGYHLANLPVDVRIGKLIIFGHLVLFEKIILEI